MLVKSGVLPRVSITLPMASGVKSDLMLLIWALLLVEIYSRSVCHADKETCFIIAFRLCYSPSPLSGICINVLMVLEDKLPSAWEEAAVAAVSRTMTWDANEPLPFLFVVSLVTFFLRRWWWWR